MWAALMEVKCSDQGGGGDVLSLCYLSVDALVSPTFEKDDDSIELNQTRINEWQWDLKTQNMRNM